MQPGRRADWVLSALLTLLAGVMLMQMRLPTVTPVLSLRFAQNAVPIKELDQARTITSTGVRQVDVLDLARDGALSHPVLGTLGPREHFFVDLDVRVVATRTARYRFEVRSDDGFALEIDGRRICAYTGDRALTTQICGVLLTAGSHHLALRYFQGVGPAGLAVRWAVGEEEWRWLGAEGPALQFRAD